MNYICKGRSQEKILILARSDVAVHIVRLIGRRTKYLVLSEISLIVLGVEFDQVKRLIG